MRQGGGEARFPHYLQGIETKTKWHFCLEKLYNFHTTYKELKQCPVLLTCLGLNTISTLPTRNWNLWYDGRKLGRGANFHTTYKELKLSSLYCLPLSCKNFHTTYKELKQKRLTFFPIIKQRFPHYLQGIETFKAVICTFRTGKHFHTTYKELKPLSLR